MAPHVLAALGRTHDPANVDARGRARARRRASRASTSTSSTERRARRSTTGARTLDGALALDVDARERVRAHRRARDAARPAGRGRRRRARRRRPGRRVPASPTSVLGAAGLRVVRGLELGAARRGVPPQPPLLERGRVPRRSAAPRTATPSRARAGGTCARPSATSPRSRAGRSAAEAGSERSTPAPRAEEAFALALRTRARRRRCADGRGRPWSPSSPRGGFVAPGRATGSCSPAHGRLLASDVTARLLLARGRWHSVPSSANERMRSPAIERTDGTGLHDRARRAQGGDPARDRRAVRRQRAAGRLADGHPDRRPRRLGRHGPQRDVGARARRLHRPAPHLGRAGSPPTAATATTSTTSPAPAPLAARRAPPHRRLLHAAPRWRWTTCSHETSQLLARRHRARRGRRRPAARVGRRCAACTSCCSSRGSLLAVVVLSNGAVEKETVVLDADADRRRRRRSRAPASPRTSSGHRLAELPDADVRRPRPATAPTRSREASCDALARLRRACTTTSRSTSAARAASPPSRRRSRARARRACSSCSNSTSCSASLLRELLGPGLTVRIGSENELRRPARVLARARAVSRRGRADRYRRRARPDAHGLPQGAGRGRRPCRASSDSSSPVEPR